MPLSEPKIIERPAQPYAAIRLEVMQDDIPAVAPPLIGRILDWVARHGEQAGPVFFNYTTMPPDRPLAMEVGAPLAAPVAADGEVFVGTLPAGRYASATWTGPYDQLREAHMALYDWLAGQHLPMQAEPHTLLEIYHTDPDELPDPATWVTEIAFKLAD